MRPSSGQRCWAIQQGLLDRTTGQLQERQQQQQQHRFTPAYRMACGLGWTGWSKPGCRYGVLRIDSSDFFGTAVQSPLGDVTALYGTDQMDLLEQAGLRRADLIGGGARAMQGRWLLLVVGVYMHICML